jgi:LPXTG-motif cell wall-anchored protein
MAQTNQGGSVLGFVVVAVIMAGLLIGGVYAVRQLTAVPEQGLEPSKTAENKPSGDQKKQETPKTDNKTDKSDSESTPPASTDSSGQQATELPQTGPGGSLLGTTVMLAVLSGVAVSYVRSRRATSRFDFSSL